MIDGPEAYRSGGPPVAFEDVPFDLRHHALVSASEISPGDLATLGVVFIEERGGRALVRLPNGSKTSVEFGALRPIGGPVHFVQDLDGPGEAAYCQACDWEHHAAARVQAEDAYMTHFFAEHEPSDH